MTDIKYITDKDFDKITLKYDGFSIVECDNGNQGQLHMMLPILLKLKNSLAVKLQHFRIDMLKYPFIIEHFYVMHKTAYLIFFNGEFIDRVDGIISYNEFAKRINGHITSLTIKSNRLK